MCAEATAEEGGFVTDGITFSHLSVPPSQERIDTLFSVSSQSYLYLFKLLLKYIFQMYLILCVFHLHGSVKVREVTGSPGTSVKYDCEPPTGSWD